MITAKVNTKGTTSWDVWRQTHAVRQRRKSKKITNSADKFVKSHKLEDFVHRY